MIGDFQPCHCGGGNCAQKGSPGWFGGEHANNQPHLFSLVSFWGHIWASGQRTDPSKPFPAPLPCSHAKIQEGNDVAKQGRGTVGGTLAGGAAAAPGPLLHPDSEGEQRQGPSLTQRGVWPEGFSRGPGPPPGEAGHSRRHQGSSASSSSSSSDATPEEATSDIFRRSGKSLLSTTSSSVGERQASA